MKYYSGWNGSYSIHTACIQITNWSKNWKQWNNFTGVKPRRSTGTVWATVSLTGLNSVLAFPLGQRTTKNGSPSGTQGTTHGLIQVELCPLQELAPTLNKSESKISWTGNNWDLKKCCSTIKLLWATKAQDFQGPWAVSSCFRSKPLHFITVQHLEIYPLQVNKSHTPKKPLPQDALPVL